MYILNRPVYGGERKRRVIVATFAKDREKEKPGLFLYLRVIALEF